MNDEVDVLVVGGGTTGLTAALGLVRHGLRVQVLEQLERPSTLPKARALNGRTMEILRRLGVADEIAARTRLPRPDRSIPFTFASTLAAAGAPRDVARERTAAVQFGPQAGVLCPQAVVEEILRDRLPDIVSSGRRACSLVEETDGVRVGTEERGVRGSDVRARYVVVADGARSRLRAGLGVELAEEHRSAYSVLVHFRADLSPWTGPRPSNICFLESGGTRSFLQPGAREAEWVLNRMVEPGEPAPSSPSETECVAMVRAAVGADPGSVEVLASSCWRMVSAVAERFVVGRAALAGDAAHQVSPFSGSGMNLGVHDADNLAWKLAALVRGEAGPGLLTSYEQERRPPAVRAVREDRRTLATAVEAGPSWESWGTAVAGRLRKDGMEFGVRYVSDAVHEPDPGDEHHESYGEYRPRAAAGHRAPHVVLRGDGPASVLDLFGDGYVLLTTDPVWAGAADRVARQGGVPVRPVLLDVSERGFTQAYEAGPGAAVLVRPDGYVAWRCSEPLASSVGRRSARLREVLAACLGRQQ